MDGRLSFNVLRDVEFKLRLRVRMVQTRYVLPSYWWNKIMHFDQVRSDQKRFRRGVNTTTFMYNNLMDLPCSK